MLCLGMCQAREESSLYKVMMSISSLVLVELEQEMIIVQRLPLNEAHIILGWIIYMLFSDFKSWGLGSIPTLPMTALTVFPCRCRQMSIHYPYDGISFLVRYGSIYVLVCIWCLYYSLLQMLSAQVTGLLYLES